ncbi:STAS domain-containing protein [Streptomyces sp. NPDC004787]|uniref:STAS domain-containing protein n=1 Tax=Streptomyces sp. NPDC004787 TaxID=3154291 RepID=UPI0033BC043A
MDDLLQAHSVQFEDDVILFLAGELDIATAPLVHQAAVAALASAPQRVYLDLTSLTFCDTTGLHALKRLNRTVRTAGAVLRIVGMRPRLRRTLARLQSFSLASPYAALSDSILTCHLAR